MLRSLTDLHFLIVIVTVVTLTSIAYDASQPLWNTCTGKDADAAIKACTGIFAGKESSQNRTRALHSRGLSYYTKNDLHRAIADLVRSSSIQSWQKPSTYERMLTPIEDSMTAPLPITTKQDA